MTLIVIFSFQGSERKLGDRGEPHLFNLKERPFSYKEGNVKRACSFFSEKGRDPDPRTPLVVCLEIRETSKTKRKRFYPLDSVNGGRQVCLKQKIDINFVFLGNG